MKILFIILVIALCILTFACVESFEATYGTFKDVQKENWNFGFLPDDVTNIRLRWNIDTWNIFGRYQFSQPPIINKLSEVINETIDIPTGCPGSPSWWSRMLHSQFLNKDIEENIFKIYIFNNKEKYYIAINKLEKIVYFWSAR